MAITEARRVQATSFPSSGRIGESWLNSFCDSEDPWSLVSNQINNKHFNDAFIGNGYIGQRIGPEGDCSAYSSSTECLIHGFWNDSYLMNPARWCVLEYNSGSCTYNRANGSHEGYLQSLSMKTATVTTKDTWKEGMRVTEIDRTVFLSRSNRHVAVLSCTITPQFTGAVSFKDVLDGSAAKDVKTHSAGHGDIMFLALNMGAKNRLVIHASKLFVPAGCREEASEDFDRPVVARTVTFEVAAGRQYTVTKVVAIATDGDDGDPLDLCQQTLRRIDVAAETASHVAAWDEIWKHRIEVPSPRIQKVLNASLFQIYSCLRPDVCWSVGPAGLTGNSWEGRVFWDADTWVYPVIALLAPPLAASIVKYRHKVLDGSRKNAFAEWKQGACVAWESAETGEERVPPQFHLVHHQRHINSDVILAQWQYYLITGDEEYIRGDGADVILECAKYWESRVHYNTAADRYEVLQVYCADEYAAIQDNNCSTNYGVIHSLRVASTVTRMLGREPPAVWADIIAKMYLPFDEETQRYIEYDGYDGETIKQADTTLMVYPYQMDMSATVKRNIVDYYRSRYPDEHIMMGTAFDGIVDCELGRCDTGWRNVMDLLAHFRGPFLLASESPHNEVISFITGLGGLLQLFVMGFAGLRIRDDGLLIEPCVPVELGDMTIRGVHFNGVSFDIWIQGSNLWVSNFSKPAKFKIYRRDGTPVERRP